MDEQCTLERQLRQFSDVFIQAECRRYASQVAHLKRDYLRSLAVDLDLVVLPKEEHESLKAEETRRKTVQDAAFKDRLDREIDRLQRNLTHQLEKTKIEHEKELLRLQERLRHLDAGALSSLGAHGGAGGGASKDSSV
jgi:hypothetical protein